MFTTGYLLLPTPLLKRNKNKLPNPISNRNPDPDPNHNRKSLDSLSRRSAGEGTCPDSRADRLETIARRLR